MNASNKFIQLPFYFEINATVCRHTEYLHVTQHISLLNSFSCKKLTCIVIILILIAEICES